MRTLNAEEVRRAILEWPSRYETRDGRQFLGETVSGTPKALINARWRNVSRLDEYDFKKLGLEIVDAQYVNGARKNGRFVRVVVAK